MIRTVQSLPKSTKKQARVLTDVGSRRFSDVTWDASDTDVSNLLDSQVVSGDS